MSDTRIPVKYIGAREFWHGTLYGVKLRFDAGQTRALPTDLALKFLTHHDTFKRGDADAVPPKTPEQETAEALEEAAAVEKREEDANNDIHDVIQRVDLMEKEQLAEFASRYGAKLDGRKGLNTLRGEVKQLVNERGLV